MDFQQLKRYKRKDKSDQQRTQIVISYGFSDWREIQNVEWYIFRRFFSRIAPIAQSLGEEAIAKADYTVDWFNIEISQFTMIE